MDRPGGQLLAGAGLALKQHGHVGLAGQLEDRENFAHAQALGHQLAEAPRLAGLDLERHGDGLDTHVAVPELERGAHREPGLGDLGALVEHAVDAADIADHEMAAVGADAHVLARHPMVGESQITGVVGADDYLVIGDFDRPAFFRPFDHHQLAAHGLAGAGAAPRYKSLLVACSCASMSFMDSPTRLGRYRLVRKIGQGGMAEVYLARVFGASGFEKRVAVKLLLEGYRGIGEYQRLLIEEAKLGAKLEHRGLVSVHELGMDQGVYFVCMDYVDGADLRTLQRGRGPSPSGDSDAGEPALPVPLILFIAEEIAHALEYVHRLTDDRGRPLGLVHRDVSPSNILISRAGEVKLADFGIAKATVLADATQGNMRKGKYAYMSPEQVAGEPLSSVSDQFGLGVTMAELCTGARPFDGPTVMATLDNIKEAARPDLDGVDEDIRRIIWTCLARNPAERFASSDQLARALGQARRNRRDITPTDLGGWLRERLAQAGDSDGDS